MAGKGELPDEGLAKSRRDDVLDHTAGLYRHTRRTEWGVAILAWEEGGKRAYQFDDGKLRIFKEGYYSLMEPVARDEAAVVRADLEEAIQVNVRHRARAPLTAEMTFDEQVAIFVATYPEGFRDTVWVDEVRGSGGTSRRKKHRDPVMADARTVLAEPTLRAQAEAGEYGAICTAVSGLLAATDLVAVSHAKAIAKVPEEHREPLANALIELLHGEGEAGLGFKAWVTALANALGAKPSWQIGTAPGALAHPSLHVCVRPSTFKRQAALFAPDRLYSNAPRRRAYANYLHVAETTRDELEKAGLQPRDLMDVHDFIWTTLRPAALPAKS